MTGIADTGFLVAFANRRDEFFPWAFSLAQGIHKPLLTCEAVLAETAFHLGDSGLVFAMLDSGLIRLAFDVEKHRSNLADLALRYADRHPDLADLCLVRMSELNPRLPVITVDGDFLVYRRNRRDAIPVLMPPGL
jgi:predicted nucleic acid-binding protein